MASKGVSNEELARMIQEGFLSMKEELHGRIDGLGDKFDTMSGKLDAHLEVSHKEKTANRFKFSETVSRVEHNQLKVRVETLESKAA